MSIQWPSRTAWRLAASLVSLQLPSVHVWSHEAFDEKPGAPFRVVVTGRGRPMILIPGLSSSGAVWDETVQHYKDKFECHVLTLAGFAGEPRVEGPLLERARAGLADYLRAKKLDKPVVVGHSLGGVLALWLAATEPDLVGPLVIVDSLPFLPAVFVPGATVESVKPQAEAMRSYMTTQSREQTQATLPVILKTMATDPGRVELALKWGLASDTRAVGEAMYELYSLDLRPQLPRVKARALVLGSTVERGDPRQVEKNFKDQYAGLAGCELVFFDKAKHFIMWDDLEGFLRETDRFLRGPGGASADGR